MTKIETKAQYDWAVKRVEELLPLVTDETPLDDPNSIELELLSNLVADYSEEHFATASNWNCFPTSLPTTRKSILHWENLRLSTSSNSVCTKWG